MKLLVIDGQPLMTLGLRALFSAVPDTKLFDTMFGQNALALYRQHKPDVVILDMDLPDSYGPNVALDIRIFDKDARFVFLTNDYTPLAALDAAQAGACSFHPKSLSASTILEAVREAAAGVRNLPPRLIQDAAILRSLPPPSIEGFTPREKSMLVEIAAGKTPLQIARTLKQPLKHIHRARAVLQRRLGAKTAKDLVRMARDLKL